MPTEERVMRAREVVIAALMREPPWNDLDRKEQERRLAIVIPSLSAAFSDEGSGIGELRAKATDLINAYDEAKDTGGHYLWQVVERKADALRAALSQSS